MNVNVRLSASRADLDEARAVCEESGVSLSKAVRDGAIAVTANPALLTDVVAKLARAVARNEWSLDKQLTTIVMPPETAKELSQFSRQLTTSVDWTLRMVVDGIRLGIIKPSTD